MNDSSPILNLASWVSKVKGILCHVLLVKSANNGKYSMYAAYANCFSICYARQWYQLPKRLYFTWMERVSLIRKSAHLCSNTTFQIILVPEIRSHNRMDFWKRKRKNYLLLCGYLLSNNNLYRTMIFFTMSFCPPFLEICQNKGFNVQWFSKYDKMCEACIIA